jgi:hypothetical protein
MSDEESLPTLKALHPRDSLAALKLSQLSQLVMRGQELKSVLARLGGLRGVPILETPEQARCLDQYTASRAGSK